MGGFHAAVGLDRHH